MFFTGIRQKFKHIFTYSFLKTYRIAKKFRFLLSEHILCKGNIVIVKKFDIDILTYLYVLRSPEFIYAIFGEMYVCMCVCACVYESEHDSF